MPKSLRNLILLVFISVLSPSFLLAQITKVSGKISDAITKVPIPFVNVIFKGTLAGTITDEFGMYSFETKLKTDTIIVSAVGFKRQYIPIKFKENNKVDVLLQPDNVSLTEVTVKYEGNPAEKLLKKVIDHKPDNDPEDRENFKYRIYNKIEIDVYNISKIIKNNFIMKPFSFMFNYTDTAGNQGKEYLPSFITESVSDKYYQKNPQIIKEVMIASKVAGSKNDNISQFTGDFYQSLNIYRNFLIIATKSFVSPIANSGIFFYRYYLSDSAYIDGRHCYKLDFYPRRNQDYTFNGHMWIHDSTFAVKSIRVHLSENVNMNFMSRLEATQDFKYINQKWVLTDENVLVDLKPVTKNSISILGRKTSRYYDWEFNTSMPDTVIRNLNNIIIDAEAVNKPESYWVNVRPDSLSKREKGIYKMVDTIKSTPTYKFYYAVGNILTTGYYPIGPVEIGQYYKFASYNPVEGFRLRLGLRTSRDLSKRMMGEGYLAYGFGDQRLKFKVGFHYHFTKNKNPWRLIGATYRQDMDQLAVSEKSWEHDNTLNSFLRSIPLRNLLYGQTFNVYYEHEWFNGLTNKLSYTHKELLPTAFYEFKRGDDTNQVYNRVTNSEITFSTRFALREKYIVRRIDRFSAGTRWPIIILDYSVAIKDFWNSDFQYHKLRLRIDDRIRINPLGFTDYLIDIGKIWGAAPWPMLFNHQGNTSFMYDPVAFNLMRNLEFAGDEYVAIFIKHNFDGFFLNKIPLIKKLKWREVVTFNALFSSLKNFEAHSNLLMFPQYPARNLSPALYQPYYEIGFGIENIFRVFRIDFIWRLSNLDPDVNRDGILDKKISPFGVKGSFNFRF